MRLRFIGRAQRRLMCAALMAILTVSLGAGRLDRPQPLPDHPRAFIEDRVLVAFHDAAPQNERLAAVARAGLTVDTRFRSDYFAVVTIPPQRVRAGFDAPAAAAVLRKEPAVRIAEPDWYVHGSFVPDDTLFSSQWGMHNTGQTGGAADADIDAVEAWDVTRGSASVKVAVIDTGVDHTHPDLSANILRDADGDVVGYDYVNFDADPLDDNGHGTHVAGTIGAVGNNTAGVAGVCHTVRIMPIKALDAAGNGSLASVLLSLDLARMLGAQVINCSFGGGPPHPLVLEAFRRAESKGILVVCAAGNSGLDSDTIDTYPAAYSRSLDNIMVVAASDHADQKPSWSQFGANRVDIAAPGDVVRSTLPGGSYGDMSGTSMAAPHVSGAAALLLAKFPTLKAIGLKARLNANADQPGGLAGKTRWGRLNLARAFITDTSGPGVPAAFVVSHQARTALRIQWRAPGDDGTVGTAAVYQIRYSTTPINAANFDKASRVLDPPAPTATGTVQRVLIGNLDPDTPYYFAIRAIDNGGNISPIAYAGPISTLPLVVQLADNAEGALQFTGWATTTSQFHGGAKSYTDSAAGNYARGSDTSMVSPDITLPAQYNAISFWAKFDIAPNDTASLEISSESDSFGSWGTLLTFTGTSAWKRYVVPLTNAGGTKVRLRFRLYDNFDLGQKDGIYIDDIVIGNNGPYTTALFDDVEGGGLFTGPTTWKISTEDSYSPTHAYTDSEGGDYADFADTSLVQIAPLAINTDYVPTVNFRGMYRIEGVFDIMHTEVSTDGGSTWYRIAQFTGSTGLAYAYREHSLARYSGQGVRVRFRLLTDGSVRLDGAHLDDIRIGGEPLVAVPGPPQATKLTVTGVTAKFSANATLKATLKAGTLAVAGETVTFKVDGVAAGSGITNASGVATVTHAVTETIGAHTITAEFAATAAYLSSSGAGTLTVQQALTKVTPDNVKKPAGSSVVFGAKLTRTTDNTPLVGRTLEFYDAATNGLIGTGTTDAAGRATITVTAPSVGVKQSIAVKFTGETNYAAGSAIGSVTGT